LTLNNLKVRAVIYAGGKTGALPQAFAADGKVTPKP